MPAVVHHTPFSRHLFNAIMGYMALDTTLFAAKIIKRRMEPGVQDATRLAAAPTTKFGAAASPAARAPPQPPARTTQAPANWVRVRVRVRVRVTIPARHRHQPTRRTPLTDVAHHCACTGWVQADLRGPLPPLEELDRLRVGRTPAASGGHTLHLCRGDEAIGYASIERSLDFSEHYGEPVYICSMEERPRLSGGEAGPEIAG